MPLPSSSNPTQCPNCGSPLPENAPQGLCPKCLFAGLALASEDGASKAEPTQTLTTGDLAPHFPQLEILEFLGRGGMGVVYKVRQKSLNRLAALKLLAPERVTDAHFAERFTREAHALAALNHPHIVTVYDFGEAGGFYFLLMEFVDGVNLRQAMQAGRFTPEQALAVVPPVCEALQYAHEHGIVHRDIKPENLLLDKAGRVKIADFGIAKILDDESRTGLAESQPAGTPQYMAPEQTAHLRADHRADIYSLGVVLYEMLTGERPQGQFVSPSKRVQVDVRIDEIVLRALEKEPELRFQTAAEMRTQVETITQKGAMSGGADSRKNTGMEIAPESRFSHLAIWGACWAPLFFITILLWTFKASTAEKGVNDGPPGWVQALLITLLLLGATSPFGTTIFGWVAVSQIRRSAEKLYGMWLAVFDGLLFPLLVLDGIIASVFAAGMHLWAMRSAVNAMRSAAAGSSIQASNFEGFPPYLAVIAPLVVIGLIVWVDWLIIRCVWRAVNRTPSTPPPVGSLTSPKRNSTGRVVAIGCGVLVLGVVVLHLIAVAGIFAFSRLRKTPEVIHEVSVTQEQLKAATVRTVRNDEEPLQSRPTRPANELRKLFPDGLEGMTPNGRKAALKFIESLVSDFQTIPTQPQIEADTRLTTKFVELNRSIQSIESGNAADRRAHSAALKVEECLVYIATHPADSTWEDQELNQLLRITDEPGTEDLARGISLLISDYARLVLGGEHADTDDWNILEDTIARELR